MAHRPNTMPRGPTSVSLPVEESDPLTREDVVNLADHRNLDQQQTPEDHDGTVADMAAVSVLATRLPAEGTDPLNTEDISTVWAPFGSCRLDENSRAKMVDLICADQTCQNNIPVEEQDFLNTGDVVDMRELDGRTGCLLPEDVNSTGQISLGYQPSSQWSLQWSETESMQVSQIYSIGWSSAGSISSFQPESFTDGVFNTPNSISSELDYYWDDVANNSMDVFSTDDSAGLLNEEETKIEDNAFSTEEEEGLKKKCESERVSSSFQNFINEEMDRQAIANQAAEQNPPNRPVEVTQDMDGDDVDLALHRPRLVQEISAIRPNVRRRTPLNYMQGVGNFPLDHIIDDTEIGLLKIRQCV